MKSKRTKYIIGFVVIIGAFTYLVWSSFMGSFKYAVSPAELNDNLKKYSGKIINLSGDVEKGSISVDESDYNFIISDGRQGVRIHYNGMVPNAFREGAEVLLTGRYDPDKAVFEAARLVTKCASKYVGE